MRRRVVGLVMTAAAAAAAAAGCSGPAAITLSQRSGATSVTSDLPGLPTFPTPTTPTTSAATPTAPKSAAAHTTSSVTRTTTSPAPAVTTTTSRPGGAVSVIVPVTEMDSGKTIPLRVGQPIQLTLAGSGTQWGGVTETPTGLLAADPTPAPPPHGVLLVWTAVRPGTVRLSATGTAWCPGTTPCPMWARLVEVTVVIS